MTREIPKIDTAAWRQAQRTGDLAKYLATVWRELRSPPELTAQEFGEHLRAMVAGDPEPEPVTPAQTMMETGAAQRRYE